MAKTNSVAENEDTILAETREALRSVGGNRTLAAAKLNVRRATITDRIAKFPELAEEFPAKPGRPVENVPTVQFPVDAEHTGRILDPTNEDTDEATTAHPVCSNDTK